MYSQGSRFIPAYRLNVPGGGPQGPPMIIGPDTPVFSSFTSNHIQNGPMTWNVPNDAPPGDKHYQKNFHVVEYNECNDSFMAHGEQIKHRRAKVSDLYRKPNKK